MLNQKLSIRLKQKLSPQQIKFIKLLQVPGYMLNDRIDKEIENNPTLEKNDFDDNLDDNDINIYKSIDNYSSNIYDLNYSNNYNNTSLDINNGIISKYKMNNIYDYLYEQLETIHLNNKNYIIIKNLIGSLDINGYLYRSFISIIDDIKSKYNIICNTKDIEYGLSLLNKFDPIGVGARTLQECLSIQLNYKLSINNNNIISLALKIVNHYFYELQYKHYKKLKLLLSCDDSILKQVLKEITKLNPKPGNNLLDKNNEKFILPDFKIINSNNKLFSIINNNNMPKLKISNIYEKMLIKYKLLLNKNKSYDINTINFIKNKIESAKWFIEAIKQRKKILELTINAIMKYQYEYFLTGNDIKLKPMNLNDISKKINMDVSAISRIINSKYVETYFGIFKLKFFFSEGIKTELGNKVSNKKIKKILELTIKNENKNNPLSDNMLAIYFQKIGYKIARRTISKYRHQLNIPVSRLRKMI